MNKNNIISLITSNIIKEHNIPKNKHRKINNIVEEVVNKLFTTLSPKEIEKLSMEEIETIVSIWWLKKIFEKGKYAILYTMIKNGVSLNINLGKYCNHHCTHCSLNANKNFQKTDINKFISMIDTYIDKKFFKYINKVEFFWSGEFFDYEEFPKILEFFLKNKINEFSLITRWPITTNIYNVIAKISDIKQKYANFNIKLSASFDLYSKMPLDKFMENMIGLFFINYHIFNKKEFTLTIPIIPTNNKEYILEQNLENILNLFINIIHKNFFPNQPIKKTNKWVSFQNFNINFRFAKLIKKWRAKKYFIRNRISSTKQDLKILDCWLVKNPFRIDITPNGDIKACPSADFSAAEKFVYTNIKNKDMLEKYLDYMQKYYKDLTLEDLLWKTNKHPCMSLNFLKYKKIYLNKTEEKTWFSDFI